MADKMQKELRHIRNRSTIDTAAKTELLEALTIMKGGFSYIFPSDVANVMRERADNLMSVESETELRDGYRQLYAEFIKGPGNFKGNKTLLLCLYTWRMPKEEVETHRKARSIGFHQERRKIGFK